jgi:hypothetical protein
MDAVYSTGLQSAISQKRVFHSGNFTSKIQLVLLNQSILEILSEETKGAGTAQPV